MRNKNTPMKLLLQQTDQSTNNKNFMVETNKSKIRTSLRDREETKYHKKKSSIKIVQFNSNSLGDQGNVNQNKANQIVQAKQSSQRVQTS